MPGALLRLHDPQLAVDITSGPRPVLAQMARLARELTGARHATFALARSTPARPPAREPGLLTVQVADGRGRGLGLLRVWGKQGGFTPSDATILAVLGRCASDLVGAAVAYRRAMRSGERFRALVRSAPVPIVEMNVEGQCLAWNPAAERYFGWTADDVIGRPCPAVPEALRPELRAILGRVFDGETVPEVETLRVRKDGSVLDVAVSVAPVRSDTGEIVGSMALIADRGESKVLRRQLQRLRAETLSPREREVVRLLREGSSYRAIARAIRRSEGTVRTLVHRAYRKLGVHRRGDLPALD